MAHKLVIPIFNMLPMMLTFINPVLYVNYLQITEYFGINLWSCFSRLRGWTVFCNCFGSSQQKLRLGLIIRVDRWGVGTFLLMLCNVWSRGIILFVQRRIGRFMVFSRSSSGGSKWRTRTQSWSWRWCDLQFCVSSWIPRLFIFYFLGLDYSSKGGQTY